MCCSYLDVHFVRVFFFKQKTAYEMRISDWSSDVCSSDLLDARGAGDLSLLDLGWQKSFGQELLIEGGHGLARPIIMDARVPQIDGYRFVYLLPFSPDRLFVEDTYYSDGPDIAADVLKSSEEHTSELQSLMRHSYAVFCMTK